MNDPADPFDLLEGVLHTTVKEGRLLRKTDTFGQTDPFVVFELEGQRFKTKVIRDGGVNPVWN